MKGIKIHNLFHCSKCLLSFFVFLVCSRTYFLFFHTVADYWSHALIWYPVVRHPGWWININCMIRSKMSIWPLWGNTMILQKEIDSCMVHSWNLTWNVSMRMCVYKKWALPAVLYRNLHFNWNKWVERFCTDLANGTQREKKYHYSIICNIVWF